MLIEVKVKVARVIDSKTRKRTENYILNKEFFSEAEYAVTAHFNEEITLGSVESFEIQSLKISQIKEIACMTNGSYSYIGTLKDIWLDNDGTEKTLKYKVLLWANDTTDANNKFLQLARQGYDMMVEGIKQADYEYLDAESYNEKEETEND